MVTEHEQAEVGEIAHLNEYRRHNLLVCIGAGAEAQDVVEIDARASKR